VLGAEVVTVSPSSGSSPVLILSNSDLFMYFLPYKIWILNKAHHTCFILIPYCIEMLPKDIVP
jgi:hypothetical protein